MSALSTIDLGLRVGPGFPDRAPGYLMQALRGVEVRQQDSAPCGFQLTFLAEIVAAGQSYDITQEPLLAAFNRVLIRVAVDGEPTTLMDGCITHFQYSPGNGPQDATYVVTGEDVSVLMDLIDYSREFPAMPDAVTVLEILAPWLAFGIATQVIPSVTTVVPVEYVPQQNETDRALLQRLAGQHGNVFYLTPQAIPFTNVAYWGPPQRVGIPSALLDVGVGAASNVDAFSAQFDALAPQTYFGLSMQTLIEPFVPLPVITLESTRVPPLATRPALDIDHIIGTRRTLWRDDQLDPVRANLQAQAMTNTSTDNVVQASCSVSPSRLGTVVCAPGIVGVRGTGEAYDGLYYLKSATHQISLLEGEGWSYTQQLSLTREGVGTTTTTLVAK